MSLVFAHQGTLYLVLDEENIERIQQHDPFDFDQGTIGDSVTLRIPVSVVVAYAHRDEQAKIAAMDSPADVVRYLRRGYREMPSDHERARLIRGPAKES
jgi:hypothetical protein